MNIGTSTATQLSHKLLALVVLSVSPLLAKPGNGNGNGNGNIAPPTPTIAQLVYLTPGTTTDLDIIGDATGNEAYNASQGNKLISGTFSNTDITINSITVNSETSLSLNITVAANSPLGGSTLTITNPNGLSATSSSAIVHITDIPVIQSASIDGVDMEEGMTNPPTTSDLQVLEIIIQNEDPGVEVSYQYQWTENDVVLDSQTAFTLPSTATDCGQRYRCTITPVKPGNIIGAPLTTNEIIIGTDCDNNGIHDNWEAEIFESVGVDPDADIDGDGLSNLEEYLFGLDPNDASSNNPIVSPLNPSTGEFEYSRPADKINGLSYLVQTSPDLINWTVQTGASQALSHANATSEVIKVGLPSGLLSANPTLFVRISAE